MTPLFTKVNLKEHRAILVLDEPSTSEAAFGELRGVAIARDVSMVQVVAFAIVFVRTVKDIETAAATVLPRAPGDPVIWFAYPKRSSKNYRCEFDRDTGWDAVGRAGFEEVRQVAIDEDWSALRFRRVERVKSLTRDPSRAVSAAGKARAARSRQGQ